MTESNDQYRAAADDARQLLERQYEAKLAAVSAVSETLAADDDAERRYAETTAARATAWKEALGAGWSEKDLQAIGLRAPGKRAPRAPSERGKRSSAAPTAEPTPAEAPAADAAEDVTTTEFASAGAF